MKLIPLLLLFLLSASVTDAQSVREKNVPSIIVNALQLKFPKATEVKWQLVKGSYTAVFELEDIDYEVWLDYNGKLQKLKRDFEEKDMPKAVKVTIAKLFAGFEVHNVELIEESKQKFYKMKLEKLPLKRIVVFDALGKIISNKED